MVDIDRRISVLNPAAHAAALRRLSTRAASSTSISTSTSTSSACTSLTPLAESILSQLRSSGVHILPGLSPSELARAEAEFGFSFPPDLRALISLGLPSGPGFPDWRSPSRLRPLLDLPAASISLQIAFPRRSFWPKSSWGPRPNDSDEALRFARSALRRVPLLLPVFHRCYLPCLPSLAGNPLFLVDDSRVSICSLDLSNFFLSSVSPSLRLRRQLSTADPRSSFHLDPASRRSLDSAARTPRWIEFWTDAASRDRRLRSSSSSLFSERFVEIGKQRMSPPAWVGKYLGQMGEMLRDGGWREKDIAEMVEVAASGFFDSAASGEDEGVAVNGEEVLDALLLKADRCGDSLRRAGWSCEDVSDALGMDFRRSERGRRPVVGLPRDIAAKIGKLAEVVPAQRDAIVAIPRVD